MPTPFFRLLTYPSFSLKGMRFDGINGTQPNGLSQRVTGLVSPLTSGCSLVTRLRRARLQ